MPLPGMSCPLLPIILQDSVQMHPSPLPSPTLQQSWPGLTPSLQSTNPTVSAMISFLPDSTP